jgi:nitrate/nitrite transporter NarK
MAMPQVHIVSYCGDLGYGPARGAEMLSLMMAFGIVSRIGSGFIADRFGGMVTLMIGSVAQAVALFFYPVLHQPDLALSDLGDVRPVPGRHRASYAIIVREAMPASEAATRVGIVIFASCRHSFAAGCWASSSIRDGSSYAAAFANGVRGIPQRRHRDGRCRSARG